MQKQWDAIWINACVATCDPVLGTLEHGAIAVKNGKIAWVGRMDSLSQSADEQAEHVHDVNGYCITPGLIDCHTHLVYAGNRANEFDMRLRGATYEDIARKGGGIQSTVLATRLASEDELFEQSVKRAEVMLSNGVTTIEIKSGYGLDLAAELKILRVIKRISEALPLTVIKTFLGAHTIPVEYRQQPDHYIKVVCDEMIPAVAAEGLADAVDVFCEKIAFSLAQTEKIFQAAKQHGLQIKCHAEQLSDSGSAALAAKYQALSVDHLEYLSDDGIQALRESQTAAVLLPGAYYYLREKKMPPIQKLREAGIPMALATDCNPGTSPILSLLLILNMGCTLFGITIEEALLGATLHAAKALGLSDQYGSITTGKNADFAVWSVKQPAELVYYIGNQPLRHLIKNGKFIKK